MTDLVKILIIASASFLPSASADEIDPSWVPASERASVTVYRRAVEGSEIDESLAITRVGSSLHQVAALILDINTNHLWIDSVDESRLLKKVSATESIVYTVSEAPWPVSDRDAIVRTRIKQNPENKVVLITSTAEANYQPPTKDRVRVQAINSSWQLTPLEGQQVEVRFRVHSDPGGGLPKWLMNAIVTEQPLNTLINMKQIMEEKRYPENLLPFILEAN